MSVFLKRFKCMWLSIRLFLSARQVLHHAPFQVDEEMCHFKKKDIKSENTAFSITNKAIRSKCCTFQIRFAYVDYLYMFNLGIKTLLFVSYRAHLGVKQKRVFFYPCEFFLSFLDKLLPNGKKRVESNLFDQRAQAHKKVSNQPNYLPLHLFNDLLFEKSMF